MEGSSIIKIFQNANNRFHTFHTKIKTVVTSDSILVDLDDRIKRYIEICTLFDSPFSNLRIPYRECNGEKLIELKELITLCSTKWRNLRLSMKVFKINGVKDHLFNQTEKCNGIGCFVEDFIE